VSCTYRRVKVFLKFYKVVMSNLYHTPGSDDAFDSKVGLSEGS